MSNQDTTAAQSTNPAAPSSGPLTIQFPETKENGITVAQGTKVTDSLGNEISGVYGIALKAEAGGLWEATFKVHAHVAGSLSVHGNLSAPRIGEAWPNEGGVYAGIIRDGARQWHLILATAPESIVKAEFGGYGKEEPTFNSVLDGQANTAALIASEHAHPLVDHLANLVIEGHNDFYIPAQKENNLLYINLPEHVDKKWHWSSTQYSAGYAWIQDFGDGYQYIGYKYYSYAVRAVRRLPI